MTEQDEVEAMAKRLLEARENVEAVTAEARATALRAIAAGVPEALVARKLGVTRMTIRRWEGK